MHKTTKIRKGKYEYRGFVIERDPAGTPGYWGSWKVYSGSRPRGTDSLGAGKALVDQIIKNREAK